MKKIYTSEDLHEAILMLETRQAEEEKILKVKFLTAYESVKPINLIKSTIKDVTESKEIKNHLLGTVLGISAGYIAKKTVIGFSKKTGRKVLAEAVSYGVSNLVSNHPEPFIAAGKGLFRLLIRAISKKKHKTTIEITEQN